MQWTSRFVPPVQKKHENWGFTLNTMLWAKAHQIVVSFRNEVGITSSLPGCSGAVNLLQGRSLNPICLAPFTQAFILIIIDPQDCAALFAPKHQTSKHFPSKRKFPKKQLSEKDFWVFGTFSQSVVTIPKYWDKSAFHKNSPIHTNFIFL